MDFKPARMAAGYLIAGAVAGWAVTNLQTARRQRGVAERALVQVTELEAQIRARASQGEDGDQVYCRWLIYQAREDLAAIGGRLSTLEEVRSPLFDSSWLGAGRAVAGVRSIANNAMEARCARWVHPDPSDPAYRAPGWE
jgi:hypothetical protein